VPATSATETAVELVARFENNLNTYDVDRFDIEDIFGAGDRCACRWSLEWSPTEGGKGTARGVDIITVRDGKIAEKLTYVTMG
jgi:ketosteroid isomerase-like protein